MRSACSADVRRGRDGGFVLIFVLGVLLLLATVAAAFMVTAQMQTKARRALNAGMELGAAADGVARLIAYRVGEQRSGASLPQLVAVDGRPYACAVGDMTVTVRVQDQAGLVDLNAAAEGLIAEVLAGLGATNAPALAAAIIDFRDPDDIARPGGAEAADYRRAGLRHGPKNAPFETVDELDQVLGMTPALLERLRPLVTVVSPINEVDAAVAPALLRSILALPAQTASPSGAIIRAGSRGRARTFGLDITARRGANAQRRLAVIEYTDRPAASYVIRAWSTATVNDEVASAEPLICD